LEQLSTLLRIEKMSVIDQTALLHLIGTGRISETKINKIGQMELTSWFFATANSCDKIIELLLSRFVVLEIPKYTFEKLTDLAIKMLAKENFTGSPQSVLQRGFGTNWILGT